jgi:hypothetical protein
MINRMIVSLLELISKLQQLRNTLKLADYFVFLPKRPSLGNGLEFLTSSIQFFKILILNSHRLFQPFFPHSAILQNC